MSVQQKSIEEAKTLLACWTPWWHAASLMRKKNKQFKKAVKKDIILISFTTIIFYIISISAPIQAAKAGSQVDQPESTQVSVETHTSEKSVAVYSDGAENTIDPCSLKDVLCTSESAPVVRSTGSVGMGTSSIMSIMRKVCDEKKMPENCAKTLTAMVLTESRGNVNAVGDGGKSIGPLQIQVKMHKVSVACAKDYECAGRWSLERMQRYGYPVYASRSVMAHNGSGPATLSYLETVNSFKAQLK